MVTAFLFGVWVGVGSWIVLHGALRYTEQQVATYHILVGALLWPILLGIMLAGRLLLGLRRRLK